MFSAILSQYPFRHGLRAQHPSQEASRWFHQRQLQILDRSRVQRLTKYPKQVEHAASSV